MDPHRLNWVEPGTFLGQQTAQDAHTLTTPFHLPVMITDPISHRLTDMPGSVIPDQNQHRSPNRLQFLAAPGEETPGQDRIGIAFDETQPDGFIPPKLRVDPAYQQAIASQSFGTRILFGQGLLHQAQRVIGCGPAIHIGLFQAAPPGFVFETQRPIRMAPDHLDQPVSTLFLRLYSGSGLVIQCFARAHFTPIRFKVARMVSPLTRVWINSCSKLTSAASSQVHTLLGFPKVRGLWCKTSLSRSACLVPKAAWVLCGGRDPGLSASEPRRLKALITSRTVSSEQPTLWAIAMACSPRALARIIWQRRSSKPSDERNPAFNRSSWLSVRQRTKIGFRMFSVVPHFQQSGLYLH